MSEYSELSKYHHADLIQDFDMFGSGEDTGSEAGDKIMKEPETSNSADEPAKDLMPGHGALKSCPSNHDTIGINALESSLSISDESKDVIQERPYIHGWSDQERRKFASENNDLEPEDIMQKLSEFQTWSDLERHNFAFKLCYQLEYGHAGKIIEPKEKLQKALATLDYDAISRAGVTGVCCAEAKKKPLKKTEADDSVKYIGKYNLIFVWMNPKDSKCNGTLGENKKVDQVGSNFGGPSLYHPEKRGVCLLHYRGNLTNGFIGRKYRLVEINEKQGFGSQGVSGIAGLNSKVTSRVQDVQGSEKQTSILNATQSNVACIAVEQKALSGASNDAEMTVAHEMSNSAEARGEHDHEATIPSEATTSTQSSMKGNQSNSSLPQVEQIPQDSASNDAEMADAAEGTRNNGISPGEDQMVLESQSNPYEIKPNDRFFEAVRSGQKGKKEVLEMIAADRSVVNSCNLEWTMTALQAAAHDGRLWMVKTLLEEGANPCPRLPHSTLHWARLSPLEIVTQFMIQTEVVKIIRSYYDRTHGKFVLPQDKDAIEEFEQLGTTLKHFEKVQVAGLRLPKEYFKHYGVILSIDERFCLGKFVQKFDKERNPTKARPKISYPFSGEDGTFMAIYYDYDDQDMIDDALGLWKSGEFMKYKDWKCENEACPCRGNDSPYNRSQVQRPKP